MAVVIYSNLSSLQARRHLESADRGVASSYERLSSGLRITSAADDAAGLAIAETLRADIAISTVAVRNANDGISAISIADSALNEISNILTRMAELSEQAATGTMGNTQRSGLSAEFVALGSEIERIAQVTTFNGIGLLSNTRTTFFQVGLDSSENSQISFEGVQGNLDALSIGEGDALRVSIIANTQAESQGAALTALASVKLAISEISSQRGLLGATESRLTTAISNLQTARENFISAESQIRSVDVAQEAANLVKEKIRQQASVAISIQANQQPRNALFLLPSVL